MIRVGDLKNLYTVLNQHLAPSADNKPRYRQGSNAAALICAQLCSLINQEEGKDLSASISEATASQLQQLRSKYLYLQPVQKQTQQMALLIDYLISFHLLWDEKPRLIESIFAPQRLTTELLVPALDLLAKLDAFIGDNAAINTRQQALIIWLPKILQNLEPLLAEAAAQTEQQFYNQFLKTITETKQQQKYSGEQLANKLSLRLGQCISEAEIYQLPQPRSTRNNNDPLGKEIGPMLLLKATLQLFNAPELHWLYSFTDDHTLAATYKRLYVDKVSLAFSVAVSSGTLPVQLDFAALKALLPQNPANLETQQWQIKTGFLLADYYGRDGSDIAKTKSDLERTPHISIKCSTTGKVWALGTMDGGQLYSSIQDRWNIFELLLKNAVITKQIPANLAEFFLGVFNQNGVTFDTHHALLVHARDLIPDILHLSVDAAQHHVEIDIVAGGINVFERMECSEVVLPYPNHKKNGLPTWPLDECPIFVEHRYRFSIDKETGRPFRQVLSYHAPQFQVDALGSTPIERAIQAIIHKAQNPELGLNNGRENDSDEVNLQSTQQNDNNNYMRTSLIYVSQQVKNSIVKLAKW